MLPDKDTNVNVPKGNGTKKKYPRRRFHTKEVERLLFDIVKYHRVLGINAEELEIMLQVWFNAWDGLPDPRYVVEETARSLGKSEQEIRKHLKALSERDLVSIYFEPTLEWPKESYEFHTFLGALAEAKSEYGGEL